MKRWLWAVWWLGVVVWSVALTTTFPVHIKEALLPVEPGRAFTSPKCCTFRAYAFLAAFAGCLRPRGQLALADPSASFGTRRRHGMGARPSSPNADPPSTTSSSITSASLLGVVLSWPWWRRSPG